MDREEFFRLKKIQSKKKKTSEDQDDTNGDGYLTQDQGGGADILDQGKDEDVIF